MVPVILEWSPEYEVALELDLDKVSIRTIIPTVPQKNELIQILAYTHDPKGKGWENNGDYYIFRVEAVEFYIEEPGQPCEVVISLQLKHDAKDKEYEKEAAAVLLNVYGWKAKN